jgi:hypothetical protein
MTQAVVTLLALSSLIAISLECLAASVGLGAAAFVVLRYLG